MKSYQTLRFLMTNVLIKDLFLTVQKRPTIHTITFQIVIISYYRNIFHYTVTILSSVYCE